MMNNAKANAQHAATASYWVTRLYSGEMTAQEERELQRWRLADAAHEQAFAEALEVWDLSAQLYRSVDNVAETTSAESINTSNTDAKPTPSPLWRKLALAASIAFVSVLIAVNVVPAPEQAPTKTVQIEREKNTTKTPEDAPTNINESFRITRQAAQMPLEKTRVFSTKVGEVSHIQLDDGSEVSLNTDSSIRVTMRKEERHIELLSGEAFFDVAKDANRPFTVATEEQQITVLGTAFNVRQRSDEKVLKVAVIEGRVAVKRRQPPDQDPDADASAQQNNQHNRQQTQPSSDTEYLLAGDIGAFSDDNKIIQAQQFEQAQTSQTWRRGIVRFDDDPLQDVIKELNRYRTSKISLRGAQTKDLKISGVFHLKNGDAILDAIAATLPVQVIKDQEHIYIAAK